MTIAWSTNPEQKKEREKPMTICRDCVKAEWVSMRGAPGDNIREPYRCNGTKRWNPVTGEEFSPLCSDVNYGNCPHYERKL